MKKYAVCIAIGLLVVAVGVFAWQNFYDGGSLMDSQPPMSHEEDGELLELGHRLVALAAGEKFTPEQIEQLKELVASIFLDVRENGIGVEYTEFVLKKLQLQIDELRLAISDTTASLEDDLEDLEDEFEDLEDDFEELQVHVEVEYLIDSKGP